MKLTTDSQIKKWKPKSDKGERASCGHGLYIQGFPNGTRAWIYRMLISEAGGKQKTVWLKIGYPASDTEHGVAGGPLRLHEARELSVRIGSIVKRGKASAAQIKNALEITCPTHGFEDMVAKPFVNPEVDFSKTPTFDELFKQWYDLQIKSKRWTHKASIQRPIGAYTNHAQQAFAYMAITNITRRMVFATLQSVLLEHHKTASDLHCYLDEVFEFAVDLEIIEDNPCPAKKKFTTPRRKVKHHGTIPASRLPELYQFVMDGKSDATFKAAAVALIVSALRVANIAYLRQAHYDPETGQFTIPEKTDDDDRLGLMKTGGQYSNVFPPEVRDMINAQMIEGHEYVFASRYNKRNINPESLRKNFKRFDPNLTSHGFRNVFKEWGHNNDINQFLVDRYTDHALKGLDASYRRFDTLEARADIARRYYAFMTTGETPAPRQQPLLQVVAS